MMKKLSVLALLLVVSGCGHNLVDVKYKQEGNDCIYTESAGLYRTSFGSNKLEPYAVKRITYSDTQCSKVIEGDLKTGINKNQTVYGGGLGWRFSSGITKDE